MVDEQSVFVLVKTHDSSDQQLANAPALQSLDPNQLVRIDPMLHFVFDEHFTDSYHYSLISGIKKLLTETCQQPLGYRHPFLP
jgi:hypothetical protein